MANQSSTGIPLLPEITCPNCWKKFPPEAILAVAGSPELEGDPLLQDKTQRRRFPPTRFTPEGHAVDVKGSQCQEYACPHCHLMVPGVLLEQRPGLFISAFGRPSCGKSYCLAAATHMLQSVTARRLGLAIADAHTASNELLRRYRKAIFNVPNPDALVALPKTDLTGSMWYQSVRYSEDDTDVRQYPRPMFYQVGPLPRKGLSDEQVKSRTQTICIYDNAGEHFEPGHDRPDHPETQHLSRSSALIFIFDPTQEPVFLRECQGSSRDPQFQFYGKREEGYETQDVILATADQSVKRHMGREVSVPLDVPLVIAVAKYDSWKHMVRGDLPDFLEQGDDGSRREPAKFRVDAVAGVSRSMRNLLDEFCPAIVTAAERMSRRVCYVPISSTGCAPVLCADSETGRPLFKHRAGSIKPEWAEVPLLWIFSQLAPGVIPMSHSSGSSDPQLEEVS
jgi:hypothetical protein